jgi:hypothetical protein
MQDSKTCKGVLRLACSDVSVSVCPDVSSFSGVLFFAQGSTVAERVYGQGGSFTTGDQNKGGISADSFYNPTAVLLDAGGLYVSDYKNHRIIYFAGTSTTATRVYGQGGDFTTGTLNKGGVSASSLYRPFGIALDASNGLFVADFFNNRTDRREGKGRGVQWWREQIGK